MTSLFPLKRGVYAQPDVRDHLTFLTRTRRLVAQRDGSSRSDRMPETSSRNRTGTLWLVRKAPAPNYRVIVVNREGVLYLRSGSPLS